MTALSTSRRPRWPRVLGVATIACGAVGAAACAGRPNRADASAPAASSASPGPTVPSVLGTDEPRPPPVASAPSEPDELAWKGDDRPFPDRRERPPIRLSDGSEVRVTTADRRPVVRRARGAVDAWIRPLDEGFGEATELVVDEARGRLFATRHSPIANGCSLTAIALEGGGVLWSVSLQGIGPQDHSKYFNNVVLALRPDGHPIVFGNEAHGRYVEVHDGRDGRALGHRLLPSAR